MTTIQKSERTSISRTMGSGAAERAALMPLTVAPPQVTLAALLASLNALQARERVSTHPKLLGERAG